MQFSVLSRTPACFKTLWGGKQSQNYDDLKMEGIYHGKEKGMMSLSESVQDLNSILLRAVMIPPLKPPRQSTTFALCMSDYTLTAVKIGPIRPYELEVTFED